MTIGVQRLAWFGRGRVKHKQFLLFVCEKYYPQGGWADFVDSFDDADEAAKAAEPVMKSNYGSDQWWEVIDLSTGRVIKEGKNYE